MVTHQHELYIPREVCANWKMSHKIRRYSNGWESRTLYGEPSNYCTCEVIRFEFGLECVDIVSEMYWTPIFRTNQCLTDYLSLFFHHASFILKIWLQRYVSMYNLFQSILSEAIKGKLVVLNQVFIKLNTSKIFQSPFKINIKECI